MKKYFLILSLSVLVWGLTQPRTQAQPAIQKLYMQGEEAYNKGEHNQAIEFYEKVIELEPDFAPAYNALGLAHKEINTDLSEVAWLFKTAIEIDPNFAPAYDNLGKAYYGLGEFDKAEASCLKALSLVPNLPSAQMSLAWIYLLGKSKPGEAIFYFEEFLKKSQAPYAYFGLGMAYFMDGNRPMVLEIITKLRELQKDDLARQLENMVRDKSYAKPQGETPLVNTTPRSTDDDSSLVKAGPQPMPVEAETNSDQSMMKVRLRGKMFGMPDKTSAAGQAPAQAQTSQPSTSAIERIRQMRGQAVNRPSNSEAMQRLKSLRGY